MTYDEAMALVRKGKTVARMSWNISIVYMENGVLSKGSIVSSASAPYIPTTLGGDTSATDWYEVK